MEARRKGVNGTMLVATLTSFPSRILGQIGNVLIMYQANGWLGEAVVMRARIQWFRILREHYQFTVFQAVRGALWLATSPACGQLPTNTRNRVQS